MSGLRCASLALAGLLVAGCAGRAPPPSEPARTARSPLPVAWAAVTPGRSTRADVQAALGPAHVLRFGSGHEVWVYRHGGVEPGRRRRGDGPAEPHELVILSGPDGVVTRVRTRLAPVAAR